MIQRIITYLKNTVTPLDRLRRFKHTQTLKIGWCGVFPPYQNGAASVSHYIVKELLKRNDIEVGIIPVNNKIDKKMFSRAVFCKIDDPALDVIIFWCLGHEFNKYAYPAKAKKIAWQTIHHDPLVKPETAQFKDIEQADLKIFMTKWAKKRFEESHINEKSVYVPFGVNTNYFKPLENNALKTKRFQLTFVSRAHYKKGIMPFLDAIPIVVKKSPDVIFHLHSPLDNFSPYYQEIKHAIRETQKNYPNNFTHNNSWIPYHKIKELYDNTSVLVFPSNNEGFGIPIIEAMSCGIPCIVSDIPPLNELVTPSVGFCIKHKTLQGKYHGIAFPDPQEIAEKILFLRKNKKKFEKMQENCRQHVKTNYELNNSIELLVETAKKAAGRQQC